MFWLSNNICYHIVIIKILDTSSFELVSFWNVEEKIKKYNLDFFVALLGGNANKDEFIVNQKAIPSAILQYTEQRLNFLKKYKKISEYDSENLMYGLIEETLTDYDNLSVACHTPMNMIIKDMSLLSEEERKYASNYLTHIDFLIYNKLTKKILLAIEVDDYNYHKEGTIQGNRDELKNAILKKYNLPLIRFQTNGSREKEKLINQLDEICKEKLVWQWKMALKYYGVWQKS